MLLLFWDVMFGSLMEMNQLLLFLTYWIYLNILVWQMVLSPGQMLLTSYLVFMLAKCYAIKFCIGSWC